MLDMARAQQPCLVWLSRQLTHPAKGTDDKAEMMRLLLDEQNAIRTFG